VKIRRICSTKIRGWLKFWWQAQWHEWASDKLEGEIHPEVLNYIRRNSLYKGG
jgi:hypothetical protein